MPRLELRLLGSPDVRADGQPVRFTRRKSLALFAYLAVTAQPHSRDALAALFWPEDGEADARASLRRGLSTLNEYGLAQWLDAGRETVAFVRDGAWLDVDAFTDAMSQHEPQVLADGLALYRGDFMAGFSLKDSAAFDTWQAYQAQLLQQKCLTAFERVTQHYASGGQYDEAIAALQRWLHVDPLHEPAQLRLIELYAATGQRGMALAQYQAYAALADEELGVPPSIDVQKLVERIRTEQPATVRKSPGSLPPVPALADLKARLGIGSAAGASRHVVVQGWPGIGKTTLSSALAHQPDVQAHFSDGILWTSLGQHPNVFAILTTWARSLGMHDIDNAQSIEEASSRLTAHLRDKRVLLITDDVWTVDHVMLLRVGSAHSSQLTTTRLNDVARGLTDTPDAVYKIPILRHDDSLALLRTLAPQAVAQHPQEAAALAADLEGLPLALHVAGRMLHAEMSMGWGIGDLLDEIRTSRRLLDAQPPADRAELALETTPTIAALLERSVAHLPEDIQQKFAMLGVFAPKPATFTLDAMAAVWDTSDARPAVRTLVDRGLLEPVQAGHFQMHALLVMLAKSMFEGLA